MTSDLKSIKEFLDEKYFHYNNKSFIENDPISIPHLYSKKEDIEIAGFLAATIAWGNRKSIITNSQKLMNWMDNSPHEFIIHSVKKDLKPFEKFVHRTFNGIDCVFFIDSLKNIYLNHKGLEAAFGINPKKDTEGLKNNIAKFRELFLEINHLKRTEKHISNPLQKSSSKRLCMFLRWMVRQDKKGVDFGIWKNISPSQLCLPLDVHTGNVSRALGLLTRKQNDWQAVEEITSVLRSMDSSDPIKYDFALFGVGVDKILGKLT
ncbi:TIGR02757 family protein [Aurantibacillus circumpalustris]|uniref:TIGR02757 family protein n=1 Tax=Aurantibacillus circumpalustris TaxID=3036359 RepID=UPI00295B0F4E|nr:TIGR02757 family protein [Aurantibacillus circumpalustris]